MIADKVIVELEAKLGKYNADVNAARANFDQNMGKMRSSAMATERQAELTGAKIGQAFGRDLMARASATAIVAALFQIGGAMAATAREAEELDSAVGFTFGKNAADIQAWAETTGQAMGRASTDLKQAALDFQTIFGPALGADAAAEMSKQFAVLVQDLSSFRNVSEDIVRQNLVSGLVGETEPLRKFGIIINDNTVKAKALEMGLVKAGQEVNDYGKIVARAQLILEATAAAQGDVARTSDSATNKLRAASSASKELGEEVGKSLNPALAAMAGWWASIANWAAKAIEKMREGRREKLLTDAQEADRSAQLREDSANPALRAQAEGYRQRARDLRQQAGAGYRPRSMGSDRNAEIAAEGAASPAGVTPSYVATRAAAGRTKTAKPKYAGKLPDYVQKAVDENRFTEASIREAYPDGNFPGAQQIAEVVLMTATGPAPIEGGYNAADFSNKQAENMKTSAEQMADALGPTTQAYATMRQNFAGAFADATIQALESGDVGAALRSMILQWGADGLRRALEGLGSTIFDAGSGGPLGGGLGGFASAVLKMIPGFASGTSSAPGGLAYVHKDELINLPKGSQVYTAAQTRAMTRGGGSQPVSVYVALSGAAGDDKIMAIAKAATMQGVSAGLAAANRSETGRRVTETLLGARPLS